MITRVVIYGAHRKGQRVAYLPRHCRNSANILSRISRLLETNDISHMLDCKWAFHLVAFPTLCAKLSIYAGGFDNRIDIIPLKLNGEPYNDKYEKSFMTPRGAVNYIIRRFT